VPKHQEKPLEVELLLVVCELVLRSLQTGITLSERASVRELERRDREITMTDLTD
jgi:hypothetical protein